MLLGMLVTSLHMELINKLTFIKCLEALSTVVTPYLQLTIWTPSHNPVPWGGHCSLSHFHSQKNTFSLTCQSPWNWFHSCQLKTQMLFCQCSYPTPSPPVTQLLRATYNWHALSAYSTSASCDEVIKADRISDSRDGVTMALDHIFPYSQW